MRRERTYIHITLGPSVDPRERGRRGAIATLETFVDDLSSFLLTTPRANRRPLIPSSSCLYYTPPRSTRGRCRRATSRSRHAHHGGQVSLPVLGRPAGRRVGAGADGEPADGAFAVPLFECVCLIGVAGPSTRSLDASVPFFFFLILFTATTAITLTPRLKHSSSLTWNLHQLTNHDLKPVERARRQWGAWNFVGFWIADSFNINTWMISSSMIVAGLSWWQAWLCVWLGYAIAAFFIVLTGRIGAVYHIGFPVVGRASFGIWGSLWPVFNRAAMGAYFFLRLTSSVYRLSEWETDLNGVTI